MQCSNSFLSDIPYSLPCDTHSAGLSTRRVTKGSEQQALRYLPDYGGVLEIPDSNIKQSGLRKGLGFSVESKNIKISASNPGFNNRQGLQSIVNDCIVATRSYKSDDSQDFAIIRALDKNLFFDSVRLSAHDNESRDRGVLTVSSCQFAHVPYPYEVTGLKYNDSIENLLIVKFRQGVKLLRINKNYDLDYSVRLSDDEDGCQSPKQPAFEFLGSFPSVTTMSAKDACVSTGRNILGVAFSNEFVVEIKLYDLTRQNQCFKRLRERTQDDRRMCKIYTSNIRTSRRQTLRSFVPSRPTYESTRQLESDPAHMLHMILLTSNRASLLDPRSECISHTYVDRYSMLPIVPTERFCRVAHSTRNHNQFYILSNMRLRAFDKRFLSQPMNSLEHMLDVTDTESINMKVIDLDSTYGFHETVCMSANGQLGFISFDQTQKPLSENMGVMINPKSIHAPVVSPCPPQIAKRTSDQLSGLAILDRSSICDKTLFSALQVCKTGNVWMRSFEQHDQLNDSDETILLEEDTYELESDNETQLPIPKWTRSSLSDQQSKEDESDSIEYLDILNEISSVAVEERLTSKRALDKYRLMKAKFQRTA